MESLKRFLIDLEKQRVEKILSDYGYIDFADVQYWHQRDANDLELAGLLKCYTAYDDAIWKEIDNLSKRSLEELQSYDTIKAEETIFEKTKSLLSKEED
jgi:hypothetical protein